MLVGLRQRHSCPCHSPPPGLPLVTCTATRSCNRLAEALARHILKKKVSSRGGSRHQRILWRQQLTRGGSGRDSGGSRQRRTSNEYDIVETTAHGPREVATIEIVEATDRGEQAANTVETAAHAMAADISEYYGDSSFRLFRGGSSRGRGGSRQRGTSNEYCGDSSSRGGSNRDSGGSRQRRTSSEYYGDSSPREVATTESR